MGTRRVEPVRLRRERGPATIPPYSYPPEVPLGAIMPREVNCPECQATLRIQDEFAGMKMRCPRCGGTFTPGEALLEATPVESVTTAPHTPNADAKRPAPREEEEPCPECGEMNRARAKCCRYCKTWLEDEEDDVQVRRGGQWVPCPRCGARGAKRVTWTFWGSFYGPALFNHVRCPQCRYAYNGKTGGSNLVIAILFVSVPAFLIFIILGCLGFVIYNTMSQR